MQYKIRNYKEGPEQDLLREHPVPRAIAKAVIAISRQYPQLKDYFYIEEEAPELSPQERYVLQLDLIRGDIIENTRVRKYILHKTSKLLSDERITVQAFKHEYRSYITECVIFYERVAYFLAFLTKAFEKTNQSFDEQIIHLHEFFDPTAIEIRNTTAHQRYFIQTSQWRVEALERRLHHLYYEGRDDPEILSEYLEKYDSLIDKQLEWITHTEASFTRFLNRLLDDVEFVLLEEDELQIPSPVPTTIKVEGKFKNDFRKKLGHRELYEQGLTTNLEG